MNLPQSVAAATVPLFHRLPLDRAMPDLVVSKPAAGEVLALAQEAVGNPAIVANPALAAGIWLYVDELDRSHAISQGMPDITGSFWHGIMHRREGDFPNSHYWLRKAGAHPAMAGLDAYDAHAFIDAVSQRGNAPDLVALQRREWAALFAWCAGR
jgi:hypothetical protein